MWISTSGPAIRFKTAINELGFYPLVAFSAIFCTLEWQNQIQSSDFKSLGPDWNRNQSEIPGARVTNADMKRLIKKTPQ
jgi:hypothetical protein